MAEVFFNKMFCKTKYLRKNKFAKV
jgi:hypothetical protein